MFLFLKLKEMILSRSHLLKSRTNSTFSVISDPSHIKSNDGNGNSFINVEHYNIRYRKVGNGAHPVLFLPGSVGFIEAHFAPQFVLGGQDLTIIAWDPPGYGRSRPPDREFPVIREMLKNDARVANIFMKKLGFNKFSILGWSYGGTTGLDLAYMFPESVQKLIVWGAKAFAGKTDMDLFINKFSDLNSWSPSVKQLMIDMYGEIYFQKLIQNWTTSLQLNYETNGGDFCSNEIHNIQCPTLIIHGLKDPMINIDHAKYLFERIKNSRLHIFPEGKHHLHLRYSKEFNMIVKEFLLNGT